MSKALRQAQGTFAGLWSELEPVGRHARPAATAGSPGPRRTHELREWFAARVRGARPGSGRGPDGQPVGVVGRPGRRPGRGHRVAPGHRARRRGVRRPARRGQRASPRSTRCGTSGFGPTVPIGVVNFVDEEGARFGVACAGSRVITGALAADRARALTDADGITWPRRTRAPAGDPERTRPRPGDPGPGRRLRRAARRAGPRAGRPRRRRWASAPASGRTAGGGSTSPARPTTPAPPGWRTGRTPCSASPGPCSRPGTRPSATAAWPPMGKVRVRPGGVNAIAGVGHRLAGRPRRRRRPRSGRPSPRSPTAAQAGATLIEESWTDPTPVRPARWRPGCAGAARRSPAGHRGRPRRRHPRRRGHPDRDAVRPQPHRRLPLPRRVRRARPTAWPGSTR